MQKHIKMSFTMVLAFAVILSMATGVLATEQEHVHNWQCAWSDDYWHCIVCSGCNEEKTTTHSKNSEGICKVCGHTPHEHVWQYTQGENYDYNHGLHCTQCAATSMEDHIYGSNGKCTVCGNGQPHEHQWKWDGKKKNDLNYHDMVCSCGATTEDNHLFLKWDGKTADSRGHRMPCGVCGYAVFFQHNFSSEDSNKERCTVCGYSAQGAAEPENKPSEITPAETRPAETKPKETTPADTRPAENQPKETEPSETKPEETKPAETEPEETMPQKAAKEGLQRSSSVWIWVATILVVVGGLGTVVFFVKKKSS